MKDATKTETIKLRVPTEELKRWRAVATSRGLSKMIRDAVSEHIERGSSNGKTAASKPDNEGSTPSLRAEVVAALKKQVETVIERAPSPALYNPLRCQRHPLAVQKAGAKRCWCGGPLVSA